MPSKTNVVHIYSCFTTGSESTLSLIEVSISPGIPTFSVIGLCDSSIREAQGRIRSAFKSAGFNMPKGHITIGISPAYMRKAGSGFDLPMAMGILFCSGQLYLPPNSKIYAEGELSLGGDVIGTPGSCLRLKTVRDMDFDYKIIPSGEAASAGISRFTGQTVSSLSDLAGLFEGGSYKDNVFEFIRQISDNDYIDISNLKGQEKAKRALLISAAGFHNLLLLGSPGCGKTLAGKMLAGILPEMSPEEMSDVYAITELLEGEKAGLCCDRPVRLIGPNITVGKLVGNSASLTPGELALANHGILFADELPLYSSEVLDFLRKPLEERKVNLIRRGQLYSFDTNFIFLGTGNPCKCGLLYEKGDRCRCTANEISRYMSKITGPFLERIDLISEMRSVSGKDMTYICVNDKECESPYYKETVQRCWDIAHRRYGADCLNGTFPDADIKDILRVPEKVLKYAGDTCDKGFFSARGFTRILRVARTIADIKGSEDISEDDIAEAVQYRKRGF